MGAVQDIVTPASANTRHHVLIAEVRGEMTLRSTGADKFSKLFASGFWPKPRQRTLLFGREHPPRSFSMRAIFAHQHADVQPSEASATLAEHEAHCRTARPSLPRRLLNV
jgi:hypothetical protein